MAGGAEAVMYRHGQRSLVWGAVLGFIAGAITRIIASGGSEGSHFLWPPHRDPGHIESINLLDDKEDVCVRVDQWSGSPGHTIATGAVYNVLALENPDEDWDGLNQGKIEFDMLYANELPFFPDCTAKDVEIRIKDDISDDCFSETVRACADRMSGPDVDLNSGHSQWGDLYGEFDYGVIYYDDDHWDDLSERRHLLNHEVGHLFGLQDGGATNPLPPTPVQPPPPAGPTPYPVPLPSVTQDPFSCSPPSIMHSYGCSDLEWPSDGDRSAVEAHIPDSGIPVLGGKGWYSIPM